LPALFNFARERAAFFFAGDETSASGLVYFFSTGPLLLAEWLGRSFAGDDDRPIPAETEPLDDCVPCCSSFAHQVHIT
jgi:hypothetical protein